MPEFFDPEKSSPPPEAPDKVSDGPNEDHKTDSTERSFKEYLSWTAPSRPFRKKDRSYFTTIAVLVVLLILLALLAQEFILVLVLLSLAFVTYVLGFVAPEDTTYKLTSSGVTIGDQFFMWHNLDSFWFSDKEGSRVLHILTHLRFPGQLILVINSSDEEKLKQSIVKHIPFHEIAPKSIVDSWAGALQKYFPLENPHK